MKDVVLILSIITICLILILLLFGYTLTIIIDQDGTKHTFFNYTVVEDKTNNSSPLVLGLVGGSTVLFASLTLLFYCIDKEFFLNLSGIITALLACSILVLLYLDQNLAGFNMQLLVLSVINFVLNYSVEGEDVFFTNFLISIITVLAGIGILITSKQVNRDLKNKKEYIDKTNPGNPQKAKFKPAQVTFLNILSNIIGVMGLLIGLVNQIYSWNS